MVVTGETVGLAELIIDDTCLVITILGFFSGQIIWIEKPGGRIEWG